VDEEPVAAEEGALAEAEAAVEVEAEADAPKKVKKVKKKTAAEPVDAEDSTVAFPDSELKAAEKVSEDTKTSAAAEEDVEPFGLLPAMAHLAVGADAGAHTYLLVSIHSACGYSGPGSSVQGIQTTMTLMTIGAIIYRMLCAYFAVAMD
jgi:hypothetical protein